MIKLMEKALNLWIKDMTLSRLTTLQIVRRPGVAQPQVPMPRSFASFHLITEASYPKKGEYSARGYFEREPTFT